MTISSSLFKSLFISSLALMLPMTSAMASDVVADDPNAPTSPRAAAVAVDPVAVGGAEADALKAALQVAHHKRWGDFNGDGKVNLEDLKGWLRSSLDRDGDGDVDIDDLVVGFMGLWKQVHKIFDVNGDGHIEFDEIVVGTHNALKTLGGLVDRVKALSGQIRGSAYLSLLPEDVRHALNSVLGLVDEAADKTGQGLHIGEKYYAKIEDALEALKKQIKHLKDGTMTLEQFIQARKDLFAFLEMIKGWNATGNNATLVNDLEKALADAKAPHA